MAKFIIRNDDVASDTTLHEIKTFCEICDTYKVPIMHAITPIGECRKIKSHRWDNKRIKATSDKKFSDNTEVIEYLKKRHDLIAVHGLYHSHEPTIDEIKRAKSILNDLGFTPSYLVPPFNEGAYGTEVQGLQVNILHADKGERLEDFLEDGTPTAPIVYLHSWRFDNTWYTFEQLDTCLKRLHTEIKLNLGSKWRKLDGFDNLDKLFGWHFQDGLPQYADESVDGITISHALMFLTDEELKTFAKEMYRVLKPGGVVRITEDDTENKESSWYKIGNVRSGPSCLTGPKMMRQILEEVGYTVYDVDRSTTHFPDRSLLQSYRGGQPDYFFIEGVKK